MTNPESKVVDAIGALVDEQLAAGPDDFRFDIEYCAHCQGEWHGARDYDGCPGAFGSDQDVEAWHQQRLASLDARGLLIVNEDDDDEDDLGDSRMDQWLRANSTDEWFENYSQRAVLGAIDDDVARRMRAEGYELRIIASDGSGYIAHEITGADAAMWVGRVYSHVTPSDGGRA